MTRINLINPKELMDSHLLAEHREIKRIPNQIKSGKLKIDNIPDNFCMGKGHVKFFIDKQLFLFNRYLDVYFECLNRGFKVENYSSCWLDLPNCVLNDWSPNNFDIWKSQQRIADKIVSHIKWKNIRYTKSNVYK